jgi:hypothetical protein
MASEVIVKRYSSGGLFKRLLQIADAIFKITVIYDIILVHWCQHFGEAC